MPAGGHHRRGPDHRRRDHRKNWWPRPMAASVLPSLYLQKDRRTSAGVTDDGRHKLAVSIAKELLLLVRDRAGMVLLFVMPAFLVIVITLIQDKVTTTEVEVLFVDNDRGAIGTEIRRPVRPDRHHPSGRGPGRPDLIGGQRPCPGRRRQISVCASSCRKGSAPRRIEGARTWSPAIFFRTASNAPAPEIPTIVVWFDPTVHGSFRAAVRSALDQVVKGVQTRLLVEHSLRPASRKDRCEGMPADDAGRTPAEAGCQGTAAAAVCRHQPHPGRGNISARRWVSSTSRPRSSRMSRPGRSSAFFLLSCRWPVR